MSDPKNERPDVVDSPETNPEDHPTTADVQSDLPTADEPVLAQEDESAPSPAEETENRAQAAGTDAASSKQSEPRRKWKRKEPAKIKITGPYAVIETGGKQYRVSVGDRISVEKLPVDSGSNLSIDRVLLLGGDGSTRVGTPVVEGATVEASVDDHFRGDKIVVFKYKAKKRYRRRQGHRQALTHLTITAINA
jgi:large subunit ribosomal protein L21